MGLDQGTRLGPYEVMAPLGAGGMGEVYRARDARLGRDVAIKVLPSHLSAEPAALARFEREARSVAALSHPHILSIFDVGREGSIAYAVTELLEGRTLRELVADGPLPPRRALEIARQIANGLAAAHQKDIVHRDLKPENLFITRDGSVKILDFGLAKAHASADAGTLDGHGTGLGPANSPTLPSPMTGQGTVLGTVGYMAPEQVRGQDIDRRADIFAFGAVLYEMLSGRRAFSAETSAETLTAILRADPPQLTGAISGLSPAIDRLTRRCLEKDREQRFQSARDLGFALDAVGVDIPLSAVAAQALPVVSAGKAGRTLAAASLVALASGLGIGWWLRPVPAAPSPAPPVAFSFDAGYVFGPTVALSPDGRLLAYTSPVPNVISGATGDGVRVEVRRLDALEAPPISVVADLAYDWSPDSRYLLASSGLSLVKFDVATGERTSVGKIDYYISGARWLPDGDVLMDGQAGIARLRAGTATPTPVIDLDPARDVLIGSPSLLPDGNRFLYVALPKDSPDVPELRLGSLEASAPQQGRVILRGVTGGQFLPPGAIAYVRARTLYVQPFDPGRAELSGEAIPIARDVYQSPRNGASAISVTRGIIVHRSERFSEQAFVWVDRAGRLLQEFPKRDSFSNFDLSPDGNRVAVTARRAANTANELWLLDLGRGIATNISEPKVTHSDAAWSPDGERLAFRMGSHVVIRAVNGGPVTRIFDRIGYPETWSPDGRYLILGVADPSSGAFDLWTVDAAGKQPPAKLVSGRSLDEPRFSPDGRWVAYNEASSDGRIQIQVIPFPPTGQRYQLSVNGGSQPRWRRDGREVYFLAPDGGVMAVPLPGGDPRQASAPALLFHASLEPSSSFDQLAPSPDGQRFLLRRPPAGGGDRAPVHILVNFDLQRALAEAERRRPTQ